MFKLSRRKGSAKWQIRKRWPSDVQAILKGEFTVSTGEEDKKAAQQRMSLLIAEYERRVAEARAQIAQKPQEELSEAEAHRMAAEFYRNTLPRFVVKRPVDEQQQRQLLKDTRDRLAEAKGMLGRNEYGPVIGLSKRLAQQSGLELPEVSPSWDYLHRLLMRAFVELHEAAAANLAGDASYRPKDDAIRGAPAVPEDKPERTVGALLDAYEADKSPGWSGSSKKAIKPVFRILRELFEDRNADSVTREDARGVVKLLESLPTNLGKRKELRSLSVAHAVAKGKELDLPTVAPKTINDGYMMHMASLFNWARKEQWVAANPFEGLSVHDPVDDADRRDPFTPEQLQTLFSAAPWDGPWILGGERAGAYWVPLLCLFHGLRMGEAAGLRTEDVEQDGNTVIMHLRAYDERRLKNREARGTLVVHPELLRLGFLGHVEERREAGETLLFPEGTANSRGQVGAKLGERFSTHVKRLGLEGRKLGMHSFRHNFEDRLREAELPDRTARALARRREVGSSGGYGDGLSVRAKADAISKIEYPALDLSHLIPLK